MENKIKKPFYKKWWFFLIVAVVLIGAFAGSGDDTPKQDKNPDTAQKEDPKKEEPKKEEEKTTYTLNEVISYKDFDITISNQRDVSGITGDSYILFDVEVVSKKDGFSFFGDFQGVTADNEVVDDTIAFVSDDLGDPISIAFTKTLDTDQKVKGYLAFDKEIDKLELSSNLFSSKKITIDLD